MAESGRCAPRAVSTDLFSWCVELFIDVSRAERKKFGFSDDCVCVPGFRCSDVVLAVFPGVGLKHWVGDESQELIVLRGESSNREGFECG